MSYFRTAILLAAMTALFMGIGFLIGGQSGMVIALIVAAAMNLFAYWNSDRMVLSMYGAREVDERSAPELVALVRQLASAAGIPMPRVYVMENPQPNAFATGRNPEHAAVAVTTGLLNTVNHEELSGVLAHELGHIKNRDTLLMTITATIAGAISMLANFGFYFGGRSNNNGNIGFIGSLLLLILGPLAAGLVQMAISRTREYEADREGAEIASARSRSLRPCRRSRAVPSRSPICPPSATRPRRISSSSIRCRVRAWTIFSPRTRMSRTGWSACKRLRARWARAPLRSRQFRCARASGPVVAAATCCCGAALGARPLGTPP